jgi:hypothetical protein
VFLATLAETAARTGWRIHAYVLMSNHYHLPIETPSANLVRGMTWLQSTDTVRYNARHRTGGDLFGGLEGSARGPGSAALLRHARRLQPPEPGPGGPGEGGRPRTARLRMEQPAWIRASASARKMADDEPGFGVSG